MAIYLDLYVFQVVVVLERILDRVTERVGREL